MVSIYGIYVINRYIILSLSLSLFLFFFLSVSVSLSLFLSLSLSQRRIRKAVVLRAVHNGYTVIDNDTRIQRRRRETNQTWVLAYGTSVGASLCLSTAGRTGKYVRGREEEKDNEMENSRARERERGRERREIELKEEEA